MSIISSALQLPTEVTQRYSAAWLQLSNLAALNALHYDSERGQFSDWGLHTEGVRLIKHTFMEEGQPKVGGRRG